MFLRNLLNTFLIKFLLHCNDFSYSFTGHKLKCISCNIGTQKNKAWEYQNMHWKSFITFSVFFYDICFVCKIHSSTLLVSRFGAFLSVLDKQHRNLSPPSYPPPNYSALCAVQTTEVKHSAGDDSKFCRWDVGNKMSKVIQACTANLTNCLAVDLQNAYMHQQQIGSYCIQSAKHI